MPPSPSHASPARQVAVRVLQRVWRDGAYAAAALQAELPEALSARDAALATAIVYGTLRSAVAIDALLGQHLRQPLARLDLLAQCSLRAAVFQLAKLDRTPPRAVLHDAVAMVSAQRGKVLGGLVNAVLRRIAASPPQLPDVALPDWVSQTLRRALGEDHWQALLHMAQEVPPLGLRVEVRDADGNPDRQRIGDAMAAHMPHGRWQPGQLSPQALLVWRAGAAAALPGLDAGHCVVQEEGAQAVGLLANTQAGERVLDACAGRGGKTTQLLAAVGSQGSVTAVDLQPRKLEELQQLANRLGHLPKVLTTAAIDWTVGDGGLASGFDRIAVDAPCSGLGTLLRRPELLLRLQPADVQRLAGLQLQILRRLVPLLRPGGELIYSVCSPTTEEGSEVAAALRAACPQLTPIQRPADTGLVRLPVAEDGGVCLGPWSTPAPSPIDLYQVFRWQLG